MAIRSAVASLSDAANTLLVQGQIYLAEPVSGSPTAPGGTAPARLNTLWGNFGWVIAVVACFVCAAAAAMAWNKRGEHNEHIGRFALALGGALAFGSIASIVGGVTGT